MIYQKGYSKVDTKLEMLEKRFEFKLIYDSTVRKNREF